MFFLLSLLISWYFHTRCRYDVASSIINLKHSRNQEPHALTNRESSTEVKRGGTARSGPENDEFQSFLGIRCINFTCHLLDTPESISRTDYAPVNTCLKSFFPTKRCFTRCSRKFSRLKRPSLRWQNDKYLKNTILLFCSTHALMKCWGGTRDTLNFNNKAPSSRSPGIIEFASRVDILALSLFDSPTERLLCLG